MQYLKMVPQGSSVFSIFCVLKDENYFSTNVTGSFVRRSMFSMISVAIRPKMRM
jgi:hypothetical protein